MFTIHMCQVFAALAGGLKFYLMSRGGREVRMQKYEFETYKSMCLTERYSCKESGNGGKLCRCYSEYPENGSLDINEYVCV